MGDPSREPYVCDERERVSLSGLCCMLGVGCSMKQRAADGIKIFRILILDIDNCHAWELIL